jgi:hypothetical protein
MSFLSQPITLQSLFGTSRMIGPITLQVVISEETNDTLTITRQPVQTGASITDHAYKEPTVLTMRILQQNNDLIGGLLSTFSGNGLAAIYQQFLDLQFPSDGSGPTPFDVITKKRVYKNMLVAQIRQTTDKSTENILALEVQLQEVILVDIGVVQVPPSRQRNKKITQATQNKGAKSAIVKTIALVRG